MSFAVSEESFDFQGLPAELREDVYDLAFSAVNVSDHDLLCKRGPTIDLRLVSKLIYAESTRAYAKAQSSFEARRKDLVQSLQHVYRDRNGQGRPTRAGQPMPMGLWWYITLLPPKWPRCEHTCASDGCYMCSAPEHRACFGCGKWQALAMYYADHPEHTPELVNLKGTSVLHTPLGFSVREGTATYKLDREMIYVPLAHLPPGLPPKPSASRHWWQAELNKQMHVAIRCKIRRRAVDRYWAIPTVRRPEFDESTISILEKKDRGSLSVQRWDTFMERVRGARDLDWKGAYVRFVAEEQALKQAGSEKKLVPAD